MHRLEYKEKLLTHGEEQLDRFQTQISETASLDSNPTSITTTLIFIPTLI